MKWYERPFGLASYRINNILEKELASFADQSAFGKKLYCLLYKIADRQYYQKGLKMINQQIDHFVPSVDTKKRKEYITDMVYSLHRFGCAFDEYFLYHFYWLNTTGRGSFVTEKVRYDYYASLNSREADQLFCDKTSTYKVFGKYYDREAICVSQPSDKEAFDRFVQKHPLFFVKPLNGSGGRGAGIRRITSDSEKEKVFSGLINGQGYVCEEMIQQSETLSSIHSSSVNTLRLTTIRKDKEIALFHPLLRMGVGDSCVDNAMQGGIFALVDEDTGIVFSEARDEKGNRFVRHPDSGIMIPGFQLPDWNQAVALVNELSGIREDAHYVAWDLAHTDSGWIMIEGNSRGQMVMQQLFYTTGFMNELKSWKEKV